MTKKQDEQEHSLEMHLPFIAKTFKGHNVKLVPILVGNLSKTKEKEYGKLLAPFFEDSETLFIISSDFCHWGEDFDYVPHNKKEFGNQIWKSIEALDSQAMELIEQQKGPEFYDYCEKSGNTICGRHPIGVLLAAIAAHKK